MEIINPPNWMMNYLRDKVKLDIEKCDEFDNVNFVYVNSHYFNNNSDPLKIKVDGEIITLRKDENYIEKSRSEIVKNVKL